MTKEQFIKELIYLLQDIPDSDREDAIAYYEDYFEAAGKEKERKVLEELQSPERVAALIKAGMKENFEETIEYSERGMGDSRYERAHEVIIPEKKKEEKEKRDFMEGMIGDKGRNGILLIGIIVVLLVIGTPVIGVGFGLFVTLIAIIFSLGVTLGAAGVALIAAGIAIVIKAIWEIGRYPGAGLVGIGMSMVMIALGAYLMQYMKRPFLWIPEITRKGVELVKELVERIGGRK